MMGSSKHTSMWWTLTVNTLIQISYRGKPTAQPHDMYTIDPTKSFKHRQIHSNERLTSDWQMVIKIGSWIINTDTILYLSSLYVGKMLESYLIYLLPQIVSRNFFRGFLQVLVKMDFKVWWARFKGVPKRCPPHFPIAKKTNNINKSYKNMNSPYFTMQLILKCWGYLHSWNWIKSA